MKHVLSRFLMSIVFLLLVSAYTYAQTTLSGTVTDGETGEPLVGVNVTIAGTVTGTITDVNGNFSLATRTNPPFQLVVSSVGYEAVSVDISGSQSGISVQLPVQSNMMNDIVIGASRVEERILESPVTVEKMDIIGIQQTASADFYDQISKMKGVHTNSGSLTITSVNTRGFATIANTRFVQLIDGMDNADPLLNFPAGNITGISELDVESVELVPGAASALYGPNAFNGILLMNSKSPFEYQGLSVNVKGGFTNSITAGPGATAMGTQPYLGASVRYAKAFNNKFAFKINFSVLDADDWRANDYTTYRTTYADLTNPNFVSPVVGAPNFDGLNTYGDETNIPMLALVPAFTPTVAALLGGNTALAQTRLATLFSGQSVNRTGFREEQILDGFDARSIKGDVALHYRINEKLEVSYAYRFGTGSGVYQGGERYAIRGFKQQFHKLELKGSNFFVRGYATLSDDGDSYNLSALGAFMNERLSPTSTAWLPTYGQQFFGYLNTVGAIAPLLGAGVAPTAAQYQAAHAFARAAADASRNALTTDQIKERSLAVRNDLFKRSPSGAGFINDSRLYHAEFSYNFNEITGDAIDILVGGNFRRYDLYSDNTVYNENLEGNGNFRRITIDEFGGFIQLSKKFVDDRLKVTVSARGDKNQNFDAIFSPRASVVFSAGADRQHNFRTSYQTGFRNPDTQAQFILFPSSTGILLGSAESNAARYGLHNGGAVDALGNQLNIRFLQPEQLQTFEVGYKGLLLDNKLMIDLNYYYTSYTNFITAQTIYPRVAGSDPSLIGVTNATGSWTARTGTGATATGGTAFRPYVNADVPINSQGVGLGLSYKVGDFLLSGTYSYADFTANVANNPTFEVGFNTPQNRFTLGVSNREIIDNLGFDINYRWQEGFLWQSAFASGYVKEYGVLDVQLNYRVKSLKTMFKVGGQNVLGDEYVTNFGGPFVGKLWYFSITFDQFMK
ncbi:MAG: TonB-dependent receptor [Cytophagales bacterium]|nr:MAG: TonB-dependent receptor [Cytophagales bacterium]